MTEPRFQIAYLPVLILWFAVAIPFTLRTPREAYGHDFHDHIQYTELMQKLHRIPYPREGGETHQPPLYYLIISTLAPASPGHVLYVRLLSVMFGACALFLLQWTLAGLGLKSESSILALIFLATTPAFLFLFSTYNNDALVILLGIFLWALFIRYVDAPSRGKAIYLGLITLAGFFSKFSFGAAAASVGAAALYLRMRRTLDACSFNLYLAAQLGALPLVFAWMYFHNVRVEGHWMSLNALSVPWQRLPHSPLRTILTPPGFTTWEWTTPFADAFLPIGKKNCLTAYAWVTSIFGEYSFHQLKDAFIWFIFWVHTAWAITALTQIRRAGYRAVMVFGVAAAWLSLAGYVCSVPYGSAIDFRHVAWAWLPLTTLQAQALERPPAWLNTTGKRICLGVILCGIAVQWALIATL